jgi:hypothetical protein
MEAGTYSICKEKKVKTAFFAFFYGIEIILTNPWRIPSCIQ